MTAKPSPLLPTQTNARIQQTIGKVTGASLHSTEHLIVALPAKPSNAMWQQFPEGMRVKELRRKRRAPGATVTCLHNKASTGVIVDLLKAEKNKGALPAAFSLLEFAGNLAAQALKDNPSSVAVMAIGFEPAAGEKIVGALLLALSAHNFRLPAYSQKPGAAPRLRTIRVCGLANRIDLARVAAEGSAINLARWLTALPPNKLDMSGYRRTVETLAGDYGWQSEFLDEKRLKKLGAGAFLAVTRGNATRDAGIVHLRYRPEGLAKTAPPAICLVGKGIIFDTGGTNLKPFKAMLDMHCDMAGSAVALATLAALDELHAPFAVDCWLAITENRISNTAYKSRDIVTACNGTTIEVIHTDAEGRMALADTLALAGREKPTAIIDFATLTGSCVAALTDRYSGAFSNRESLHELILDAGRTSGERVWPFPMDDDFDTEIESKVADVLQCAAAGGGDHIQAARFLNRFVPARSAWIHVDLSAATRTGGLAQVPTEITGFGVRFALNLVLDQHEKLLQAAGDK